MYAEPAIWTALRPRPSTMVGTEEPESTICATLAEESLLVASPGVHGGIPRACVLGVRGGSPRHDLIEDSRGAEALLSSFFPAVLLPGFFCQASGAPLVQQPRPYRSRNSIQAFSQL